MTRCSPLARGWSPFTDIIKIHGRVLPARAGMVPRRPGRARGARGAPRSRGDGPAPPTAGGAEWWCSPLARGWSRCPVPRPRTRRVLPARAGMVPSPPSPGARSDRAPRSRGDGPTHHRPPPTRPGCSPLARGWSPQRLASRHGRVVLPARAGMVPSSATPTGPDWSAPRSRGDGPLAHRPQPVSTGCSPLARGWSPGPQILQPRGDVLPARAGMVRHRWQLRDLLHSAPRSRGDGPTAWNTIRPYIACSPLARGWSPGPQILQPRGDVLPARAGMVRHRWQLRDLLHSAPRSRGDGPTAWNTIRPYIACSPLARGWSQDHRGRRLGVEVLPARAGMVRLVPETVASVDGAPRSRGDGPVPRSFHANTTECSPLARGWSRVRPGAHRPARVLPARAGMVPRQHPCPRRSRRAPRSRGDGPA